MVFSHLLRRGFTTASHIMRTKLIEKTTHNRLFIKKFESSLLSDKRLYSAYEGDGKTVGFIINKKNSEVLFLLGVTNQGFILSNGAELVGPLIIFPHSLMSWNVLNVSEVSEDSLALFRLMDPKVDLLVLGYGSPNAYTKEIRDNFQKICKKFGVRYEALPTEQAIGVYNFLADDRRLVAAALIPPTDFSPFRFDDPADVDLLEGDEESDENLITDEIKIRKLLNKA